MSNVYTIKLDVKQNDFYRYVIHSNYYDSDDLNISALVIKNELMKQLDFMSGVDTKIKLRVLHSDTYNVYIVFDFVNKDVFYETEYSSKENTNWVALVNFSQENKNHISVIEVDETWFASHVEKPTKLIVSMYYNEIVKFIQESCMELQRAKTFVDDIVANVKKNIEKETKENIQNDVDKTDKE